MRKSYWLLLACAILSAACAPMDAAPPAATPDQGVVTAEPRGIVGELCPPALAAKGYC